MDAEKRRQINKDALDLAQQEKARRSNEAIEAELCRISSVVTPGEYTSDDLDRLVREADRKAAKLRHLEYVIEDEDPGCDIHGTGRYCGGSCLAECYEDDGYRYDPVEGESMMVER